MSTQSEDRIFSIVIAVLLASGVLLGTLGFVNADEDSWTIDGNTAVHIHEYRSILHKDYTTITTYTEESK